MSKTATKTANVPALVPQPGGRGALYAGGVPGNKGGPGRPANWLKARMAAALRSADASKVVRDVIAGTVEGARVADRLSAIDLGAKLADLVPERGASLTVTVEESTGEERLARVLQALPALLASLPVDERMRLAQAVSRAAGDVRG